MRRYRPRREFDNSRVKLRLPIFKPGRWAPPALDAAAVRRAAELYDPASDAAPLVIGHPRTEDPKFGTVASLDFSADEVLFADFVKVDPNVKTIVDEGQYDRVSASFWRPSARSNPHPGHFTLRHVGLLGAQAPGCPGLGAVAFEADDGYVSVDSVLPEWEIDQVRDAASEAPDSSYAAPANPRSQPPSTEDSDMDEQALAAREAAINEAEAALAARLAQARRDAAVSFADAQAEAGRVLPAETGPLADVLAVLEEHSATVDFADDDTGPAAKWLREFVSALPARVPQGEIAADTGAGAGGENVVSFAAPDGRKSDADRLKLHEAATAHAAEHKTSYIEAVRAVQQRASA